jgi:hypothetical protein
MDPAPAVGLEPTCEVFQTPAVTILATQACAKFHDISVTSQTESLRNLEDGAAATRTTTIVPKTTAAAQQQDDQNHDDKQWRDMYRKTKNQPQKRQDQQDTY